MARQAGPLFITGTIGDMVFYQMNGIYYMRRKGEPTPTTKKRMSQKEHYALLCLRKQEFKQASQMVREWYYTLPKAVRKHGLFGTLTGKAVRMWRKGKTEEEIKTVLVKEYGQVKAVVEQPRAVIVKEVAKPAKAVPQPSCISPKPKRKAKKAITGRLSSWQVGEQGLLQKEVVTKKAIVPKQEGGTVLYAGYYSSWSAGGW